MVDAEQQLEVIRRGAVEIIAEPELREKLRLRRPLRVKAGFDPSAPDLHLGHTVLLRKLRQFQDLGHEILFLIGDYTGLVGDPTGQSQTRQPLTYDEVLRNAESYRRQVAALLDVTSSRFRLRRNSEWFAPMRFDEVIRLASRYTVARLLERDDFQKRLKQRQPISALELLYPLMQGYDSVALEADIELGGTDQTFNLLVGRELQREYGQSPQVVITLPLLVGTDGAQKMSKSLGNQIGIAEPPEEMFGKLMSIPDPLIWPYFELLTDIPMPGVAALRTQVERHQVNPKQAKEQLARRIVAQYHGAAAAEAAATRFDRVFSQRQRPEEIPLKTISAAALTDGALWIVTLLHDLGLAKTNGEARRAVEGGGVQVDGVRVDNPQAQVAVREGTVVSIGRRRFAKVTLK